jgi:hypothetical protein
VTSYASDERPVNRRVSRRSIIVSVVLFAAVAGGVAFVLLRPAGVPFRAAPSPLGQAIAWGPDSDSPLYYLTVSQPFGDGKTTFVLRFRPHSQFRFGVGIPNKGRSPVRIDGIVTTSPDYAGMMRITGLQMQHRPNAVVLAGVTSKPLVIEPGGFGYVVPILETRGSCTAHGTSEAFDSVQLKYTYRGAHRTTDYSLPVVVGVYCGNPKSLIDNVVTP